MSFALVGIRSYASAEDHCAVCASRITPCIALIRSTRKTAENAIVNYLCLPCVAKAVESATHWKVMRAWSQWMAVSAHAAGMRSEAQATAREKLDASTDQ